MVVCRWVRNACCSDYLAAVTGLSLLGGGACRGERGIAFRRFRIIDHQPILVPMIMTRSVSRRGLDRLKPFHFAR